MNTYDSYKEKDLGEKRVAIYLPEDNPLQEPTKELASTEKEVTANQVFEKEANGN